MPDVITVEVLAARDGLLLVLEMDNMTLVNYYLKVASGGRSTIAGLWHEIHELCKNFVQFCFSFVMWDANSAAHSCAKICSCNIQVCSWMDDPPQWLMEITIKDKSGEEVE